MNVHVKPYITLEHYEATIQEAQAILTGLRSHSHWINEAAHQEEMRRVLANVAPLQHSAVSFLKMVKEPINAKSARRARPVSAAFKQLYGDKVRPSRFDAYREGCADKRSRSSNGSSSDTGGT